GAWYCLFKLTDSAKIESADLWEDFETPERANKLLKLKSLHRFTTTAIAVEEITALQEGKLGKGLKKFLSDEVVGKGKGKETLAVFDAKLGNSISKKLGINVVGNDSMDLFRGIRGQLASLLDGLDPKDLATMSLGLSHSLSGDFKLKFSPDKVDTMVVQAIALLDDLDKEINIYAMRVKEWYGWHFPELAKIIVDNQAYAKVVKTMATVKAAAEISMGTEISDSDIAHIHSLCDQVVAITVYRTQLAEYLRNRMNAIAPNLTALVGELVGARLISHAGSLLSLAKHPASTVQILGAEKALFRALKTKHDTPKYGLIYHASLIGQAPPKLKGKLADGPHGATKAALSIRVDALSDVDTKSEPQAPSIGIENRAKLEARLRSLEGQGDAAVTKTYNDKADFVSTQREPVESAVQAALDVKAEKRKAKEERRAKRRAEKEAKATSENGDGEETKESKKEKKRKRRDSEAEEMVEKLKNLETEAETEAERKAKKKARKAEKAAAQQRLRQRGKWVRVYKKEAKKSEA
ncbi:uncharacterized protein B0H18DRAFT_1032165, partial [Fomitopsis serialis]|uniref:uncharacterized protein n=1 Tax=Fomitopsis serialis TaxID=139415 RepID=UPI0020084454